MEWQGVWRMALRVMARNKLRTLLTMLGITIGIAAVICTVAIGQGGQAMIREQMEALGTNLVWVEAGGRNVNGVRTGNGATKTLTLEDNLAIRRDVPLIGLTAPNVDGSAQIAYGNQNWYTRYRGIPPEYFAIAHWQIAEGSLFSDSDVARAAGVCLLGKTVAENLFPHNDPLGATIRVGALPCQVVGTLAPKGLSVTGSDQDDFVMLPYTTAMKKLKGQPWLDDIFCSAVSTEAMGPAENLVSRLLRSRHHLLASQPDDFNIRHPQDLFAAQQETSRTLTLMFASIASVSLLVGGIGIMNIMLVSVTERTREIGVRMAVGATEQDVQRQFLAESVLLSLVGGVAGVVFGVAASSSVSRVLEWPTLISATSIVVAAACSVFIGIFFGYYPAQKASRLDPIEALRYE
jgi:putative ABC transport system permease protein